MRLEAGVGSGEVLEVALELGCRCCRGRGLGASGVELGLELTAAGSQVRRGRSVRQGWCGRSSSSRRRDARLLQLAGDGFNGGGRGVEKRVLRREKGERDRRSSAAPPHAHEFTLPPPYFRIRRRPFHSPLERGNGRLGLLEPFGVGGRSRNHGRGRRVRRVREVGRHRRGRRRDERVLKSRLECGQESPHLVRQRKLRRMICT